MSFTNKNTLTRHQKIEPTACGTSMRYRARAISRAPASVSTTSPRAGLHTSLPLSFQCPVYRRVGAAGSLRRLTRNGSGASHSQPLLPALSLGTSASWGLSRFRTQTSQPPTIRTRAESTECRFRTGANRTPRSDKAAFQGEPKQTGRARQQLYRGAAGHQQQRIYRFVGSPMPQIATREGGASHRDPAHRYSHPRRRSGCLPA